MRTTTSDPVGLGLALVDPGPEWGAEEQAAFRAAVVRSWRLDEQVTVEPGTTRTVLVLAGDPYGAAARRYAAATGAGVREVDDVVAAMPGTGTVIVAAEPERLSFDLVEAIAERALDLGIRVGYLTAPDLDTFDLVLGKAARTLGGGSGRAGRGWVDELRHDNGREVDGATETRLPSPAVLAGSYRTLYVSGHGDGLHVRLHDATICGLVGAVETYRGRPVRGGCRRGLRPVCKKGTAVVVPAGDLRADLVVVLSCKSFVTRSKVYPSSESVLLSAASGLPGAFVGTTREVRFDDDVVDAAAALVDSGLPIGDVVTALNDQQARRGAMPCVALLGDPDATFAPAGSPVPVVAWPAPPVAVRPPDGATYLLHGRARTYLLGGAVATPPVDATDDLVHATAVLTDARQRITDGEALERVASSYARALGADDGEFRALVDRVASARHAVADEVWGGLGTCVPDTRHRTTWHRQLDTGRVSARVRAWHDATADLVAGWFIHEQVRGQYVADHFFPSLTTSRTPGRAYVVAERCPSCDGRLTATDHTGDELGLSRRTAVMCASCGPTATYGRLRADLRVRGGAAPGDVAWFDVAVEHPEISHGSTVAVVLQVKPRSTVNPPMTLRQDLAPQTRHTTFELRLPDDAACDMWSARCGVTSDGEVAFARRMFAPIAVD